MSAAREELGPVANRVGYGGETVHPTKHGKRTVAVVPAAAAEPLEDLEELIGIEAARGTGRTRRWQRSGGALRPAALPCGTSE
ncbi:hypothetical protein [Amycolatopsis sp.]|uniref:hypothetical protein n=1 Tax=Amycolatopsis sp. TaxID=37632 RepID=UPI0039C884B3